MAFEIDTTTPEPQAADTQPAVLSLSALIASKRAAEVEAKVAPDPVDLGDDEAEDPEETEVSGDAGAQEAKEKEEISSALEAATLYQQAYEQLRDEAQSRIGQYEAGIKILQADNDRLLALVQQANLVDDRDLTLRKYELEAAMREQMLAHQKAHAESVSKLRHEKIVEQKTEFFAREIPLALGKYPLVSERELCAAIQDLPQEAPEDIDALAKQLNETKMIAAKRALAAERRSKRAMPSAGTGQPAPAPFTPDAAGFASLLQRHLPGR